MTQDEIIEMARQAGFWKDLFAYPEFKEHLEAFAKLVDAKATAKEREACAMACYELMLKDNPYDQWRGQNLCMDVIRARGEA